MNSLSYINLSFFNLIKQESKDGTGVVCSLVVGWLVGWLVGYPSVSAQVLQ